MQSKVPDILTLEETCQLVFDIYKACDKHSKQEYAKRRYPFTMSLGVLPEYQHGPILLSIGNTSVEIWAEIPNAKKSRILKKPQSEWLILTQEDLDASNHVRNLVQETYEQLRVDSQKSIHAQMVEKRHQHHTELHLQKEQSKADTKEREKRQEMLDSIGRDS